MSFYDDASLVVIPSAQKTSKLYAVKPTDGSGDLTFTRTGDTATRVNSAGLIERVRTNLALQSQTFDNASWYKEVGNSATANTIANPLNGAVDADTITATATNAMNVNQLFTAAVASEYTYSIYLKKNNHDLIQPYIFSVAAGGFVARIEINLSDGTFTTINGSGATVTSVGSGWYRVTLIAPFSTTNVFTTGFLTSSTTGSRSVYVFGAQLETGVATPYIATTTAAVSVGPVANVPRLDYLGSTCGKLLLEPQRTNLQLNSEDFSQSNWSKTNTTIVVNQLASPDGFVNADKLNETAVNNLHQLESSRSVSASTVYTMSVFAKKAERSFVRIYDATDNNSAYFNLDSGTIGTVSGPTATAKIENYGNGWYRCSVTYTETGTFGRYRVTIAKQDNEASYLGVVNSGIYVWGAQYELGAYATSYIPTLAASATRGADACSKTGISSLIGQTEGTIFWEFQVETPSATGHEQILNVDAGSYGNTIYLLKGNAVIIAEMYVSGVAQALFSKTAVTAGTYKCALGYANNNTAFFVNGVQVGTTDTSCTIPAMSRIQLGNGVLGPSTDLTKQSLLFKTRLTNAELAELTTL